MKLRIRYIIIGLLLSTVLCAQQNWVENIKRKTTEVNNLFLYKAYFIHGEGNKRFITARLDSLQKSRFYIHTVDSIYFDSKGLIRKLITTSAYSTSSGSIRYYDTEGYLLYASIYDYDEGLALAGKIFCDKGKVLQANIMTVNDNDLSQSYKEFKEPDLNKMVIDNLPKGYQPFRSSNLQIKNMEWYSDKFESTSKYVKIRFTEPYKGSKTVTNNYNINVRVMPTLFSKIIDVIRTQGLPVEILEEGINEDVLHIGSHPWYKIKYYLWEDKPSVGYIYGAFLEPVEKEVK